MALTEVGSRTAGFLLIALTGIAVVAATAWAATVVLARVPAEQPARLRPVASAVVAGGMALAAIAALIWGLLIRSGDPGAFHADYGILATPFVPSWIAVTLALGAATALAGLGARRQLAASR